MVTEAEETKLVAVEVDPIMVEMAQGLKVFKGDPHVPGPDGKPTMSQDFMQVSVENGLLAFLQFADIHKVPPQYVGIMLSAFVTCVLQMLCEDALEGVTPEFMLDTTLVPSIKIMLRETADEAVEEVNNPGS